LDDVTVFVIGNFALPRLRWVSVIRGRRLVHEALWSPVGEHNEAPANRNRM
jgi:hypothetical protein